MFSRNIVQSQKICRCQLTWENFMWNDVVLFPNRIQMPQFLHEGKRTDFCGQFCVFLRGKSRGSAKTRGSIRIIRMARRGVLV